MSDWSIIRTDVLTQDVLLALLNNEIGAICLPSFASNAVCTCLVQSIYAHGIDYYKDKYPKVGKIGITQSEHKYTPSQKEEYFAKVSQANRVRQSIFGNSGDLLSDVITTVKRAWAGNVDIAFEKSIQQQYFAGLVRVINQAMLHYDWAPLYDLGWETDKISAQLTWNIYLQVGARGGATRVYRQFGRKADLKYVTPGGYFDSKVVTGADFIEIMPEQGELVFFNSQNYHEVEQTEGEDERITFSSFIGLLGTSDALIFWS
jgi:carrier-protein-independent halogenase WelO5-like protein